MGVEGEAGLVDMGGGGMQRDAWIPGRQSIARVTRTRRFRLSNYPKLPVLGVAGDGRWGVGQGAGWEGVCRLAVTDVWRPYEANSYGDRDQSAQGGHGLLLIK